MNKVKNYQDNRKKMIRKEENKRNQKMTRRKKSKNLTKIQL